MRHQEVQIGFERAGIDSERTGRSRIPGRLSRNGSADQARAGAHGREDQARVVLRPRELGPPRCGPGRPPLPLYASRDDPTTGTEGYRPGWSGGADPHRHSGSRNRGCRGHLGRVVRAPVAGGQFGQPAGDRDGVVEHADLAGAPDRLD